MKPDYDEYNLDQLIEARRSIDVESYPDRAAELDVRIARMSPAPEAATYYPREFRELFPGDTLDLEVTNWTEVHFDNEHRVKFTVPKRPSVTLDRNERQILVVSGEVVPFDQIEAVTVTRVRSAEWLDEIGVWTKPIGSKAVRIASLSNVSSANRLAEFLGGFVGASNIQVL